MKIRKLIFSAKLEQIEKQNQNIFIFHCSANAAQWRFLKNFLFNKVANLIANQEPTQTNRLQANLAGSTSNLRRTSFDSGLWQNSKNGIRGFIFYQSTSFKKEVALTDVDYNFIANPAKQPNANLTAANLQSKSMYKKFRPKGCLFFFDTRSHTLLETLKKNSQCLELVNKIESLEFNNDLILLYGQIKSNVVNHVDIKEAFKLNAQTTYEEFFISMRSVSIALHFCLHQKIDEFFSVQETRKAR